MNHYEFFEFLKQWRELQKAPPTSAWPKEIVWGKDFWQNISRLYKYTDSNKHEYETAFFFVDGEIVATEPYKGEEDKVSTSHRLQVRFVPAYGDFFNKEILLDDKMVKKIPVKQEKLPDKVISGFLFNAHSHPPQLDQNNRKNYGFFSDVDINSLMFSQGLVSGLVTDEFWLACKSDSTPTQLTQDMLNGLAQVSHFLYQGEKNVNDLILEGLKELGIVFYRAEFNRTLRRI